MSHPQKTLSLLLIMGALAWWLVYKTPLSQAPTQTPTNNINLSKSMNLSSPAFNHQAKIPSLYTCDGENINPKLVIRDLPEGVLSLALIVDDPDAVNGDWTHWLVWNISPEQHEIAENNVPKGSIQGLTDFGNNQWGGPCPGSGSHHYFFRIYALDKILNLPPETTKKDLLDAMKGHILAKNELIGIYKRTE